MDGTNAPEFLTAQELADELGVHVRSVLRAARQGRLPAHVLNSGQVVFIRREVVARCEAVAS